MDTAGSWRSPDRGSASTGQLTNVANRSTRSWSTAAPHPATITLSAMPPQPHRPPDLEWRVFRGADAVRRGLLTEHQLRSQAWIRLRQDVYADARLDRDHALVCRAVALRTPPGVLLAGPSAAYLHGVDHAAAFTDDVHVIAAAGCDAASCGGR